MDDDVNMLSLAKAFKNANAVIAVFILVALISEVAAMPASATSFEEITVTGTDAIPYGRFSALRNDVLQIHRFRMSNMELNACVPQPLYRARVSLGATFGFATLIRRTFWRGMERDDDLIGGTAVILRSTRQAIFLDLRNRVYDVLPLFPERPVPVESRSGAIRQFVYEEHRREVEVDQALPQATHYDVRSKLTALLGPDNDSKRLVHKVLLETHSSVFFSQLPIPASPCRRTNDLERFYQLESLPDLTLHEVGSTLPDTLRTYQVTHILASLSAAKPTITTLMRSNINLRNVNASNFAIPGNFTELPLRDWPQFRNGAAAKRS